MVESAARRAKEAELLPARRIRPGGCVDAPEQRPGQKLTNVCLQQPVREAVRVRWSQPLTHGSVYASLTSSATVSVGPPDSSHC